jgi:hypothetical protein
MPYSVHYVKPIYHLRPDALAVCQVLFTCLPFFHFGLEEQLQQRTTL